MRIPPRAKKCTDLLREIEELMRYFLPESAELSRIKNNINYLKEYIIEISEEKKLTEIKLAVKIKKDLE